jgi:hypothetical protein
LSTNRISLLFKYVSEDGILEESVRTPHIFRAKSLLFPLSQRSKTDHQRKTNGFMQQPVEKHNCSCSPGELFREEYSQVCDTRDAKRNDACLSLRPPEQRTQKTNHGRAR